MKFCNQCNAQYDDVVFICPQCGTAATQEDGVVIHAPDMAHEGGGFNPAAFAELAKLEEKNFWFRARNQLIVWLMKKFVLKNRNEQSLGKYLEIGCGTGYVLEGVKTTFKNTDALGSEIFLSGLEQAKQRLVGVNLMQMDARAIPYQNEFDVMGAFDVLEHIKEDEKVIAEVYRALKPGGIFIATVPQHDWLWSKMDDYACHERRYKPNELQEKMKAAGFEIVKTTSFVSLLVPLMYLARSKKKDDSAEFDPSAELDLNPALNSILYGFMKLELGLIKMGVRFPIGGSRLIVGQK
ncbi:MAG: class I SAM-dependent methyltransferase [Hydrogenovibrio sp.]|uniref:class I SAM-dependent methyltransferase n=1 Tax=Hydrogenovibrio sp. TaxID=2065821 RepID=UPI00287035AA|nr:class I SAM-dependent methyltransferase [Hydrogenovibrio sp.]MDR9498515.1 class I SAM-dependent methyltransferase [Hydrogenovibrio sp.]MDR9499255.1 class I SAM-dependent methyltransferase [Hydrogenovibrio sp.]